MPKASVKRLIDNRKDKLIEFVLDIEKYPEFIPFCDNSKVYERSDNGDTINIIADLTIGKGPLTYCKICYYIYCIAVITSLINF